MKRRTGIFFLITIVMLCNAGCITHSPLKTPDTGQHPQSFNTEVIKSVEVNYLLYIPDTYAVSQKKWPLILFLHGAGERGNNLKMVEMHGPPKQIAQENKTFPFLVVSPQCPEDEWWSSGKQIDTLSALLDHIVATYRVDEDKIYVTGLSMGGFGTWRLACEYPDRFAAIAPICGRGDPYVARALPHLPVWVFHGAKDSVVPLQASREMVDALKKVGGNVKFTVYPDAGHNSWSETYNNPALYQWFLKHTRSNNK